MAWYQASEVHDPGAIELPDERASLAGSQRNLIRSGVLGGRHAAAVENSAIGATLPGWADRKLTIGCARMASLRQKDRPFAQGLSPRSTAYALSVLAAMFRWLIQQRYVLANPFAGIKVRGSARAVPLDTSHAFTEGEWLVVRTLANGLEWSYGGGAPAAQRLRFVLDFAYATGLRASELVGTALGGTHASFSMP